MIRMTAEAQRLKISPIIEGTAVVTPETTVSISLVILVRRSPVWYLANSVHLDLSSLTKSSLRSLLDSETDTFAENTFRNDPSKVCSITIPMIVSADIIRLSMWPN